jgi:Fungalysin metallopeptidase (M36)
MAIHFIPNDPLAGPSAPPMRRKQPRRNRPAGRADLKYHDPEPEGLADPGTATFLFWQCREAALMSLAAWERHSGPLSAWEGGRRRLHLFQNAVVQLGELPQANAFYDRSGFLFFEVTRDGRRSFTGASTDVVSHELGHGLLDALRPDLWDTPFLEVNAFHEAFGDCVAMLTALDDVRTRTALARVGVRRRNFVETWGEELADTIRRADAADNAAVPRRALNTLCWQLPSSLARNGKPGELIAESHSFARVFTGCFWDLFRNLLDGGRSSAALRSAADRAAWLLLRGAAAAPEEARFFQAVGRAMVLADEREHGGAHHEAIRDAFAAHGIALGSRAMLAPVAALEGPAPSPAAAGGAALSPVTRRDLRDRLGAGAHARMVVKRRAIGGRAVVKAVHEREIPLGAISPKLRGVVAIAPEPVLIGRSGRRAAVLGGLPEPAATKDEVAAYVESLVTHDRIDYGSRRDATAAADPRGRASWYSHGVRSVSGRRVLKRLRFACRR